MLLVTPHNCVAERTRIITFLALQWLNSNSTASLHRVENTVSPRLLCPQVVERANPCVVYPVEGVLACACVTPVRRFRSREYCSILHTLVPFTCADSEAFVDALDDGSVNSAGSERQQIQRFTYQ